MGKDHSILVVDDHPGVRKAICAFVEKLGHDHARASSCAEALQLAQVKSFSCAIIDLNLPDGNGLALLPSIRQFNPCCVPIILTGDTRPETIVETIREGAFDYLIKPVDFAMFRAAVSRALHHNEVIRQRDTLLEELCQERELLKARVAEANSDLRQHATRIELVNARQEVLLQLNQMSDESYTEEDLFRRLFEQLVVNVPLQCAALATTHAQEYCIAAMPSESGETAVVVAETPASGPLPGSSVETDVLHDEIRAAVERHAALDTGEWTACVYPQKSLDRVFCAVAFFLPGDYAIDTECDTFLRACASTVTSKWQDLRLFQYAAKQASVGNLALDLSRDMVQELTAIRTAGDVVLETDLTAEAAEGMRIIGDNVEDLRRRLQDLRQLSSPHKSIGQTVYLDRLADQALDLLASTTEHRGIVVDKEYLTSGQCVLLNGAALSSTILDLISTAVRAAENDQHIALRLWNCEPNSVMLEISFEELNSKRSGVTRRVTDQSVPSALRNHPKFIMAQRTIRSCGGTLSVERKKEDWCAFCIVLPKNALSSSRELEEIGLS